MAQVLFRNSKLASLINVHYGFAHLLMLHDFLSGMVVSQVKTEQTKEAWKYDLWGTTVHLALHDDQVVGTRVSYAKTDIKAHHLLFLGSFVNFPTLKT